MKQLQIKIVYGFLMVALLFNFSFCNKDSDNTKEWGIAKIYMPQAVILDGGITNIYSVPNTDPSKNYTLDTTNGVLQVTLGVLRSGLQSESAYSVKVQQDTTTSNAIVSGGTILKSVVLPAEVYSLPASVSVPDGKREANFYLSIDLKKLVLKYPGYYSKKMVIVVGISDPTKYELDSSSCKTTIVINGSTFMPMPPRINLLKGGTMDASSEAFWTKILQSSTSTGRANAQFSFTGILTWKNGTGSVKSNDAIYQTIQLIQGHKYRFSTDITSTGATGSWLEVHLGTSAPTSGGDYAPGLLAGYSTSTTGCFTNFIAGDVAATACVGSLAGTDGIFTSTVTGTMYFVIKGGSWSGSLGTVTLDNVIISEEL